MTKPHLALVTPTTEIQTVARHSNAPADECRAADPRTLGTAHEVEKLIEMVKRNRHGRRERS